MTPSLANSSRRMANFPLCQCEKTHLFTLDWRSWLYLSLVSTLQLNSHIWSAGRNGLWTLLTGWTVKFILQNVFEGIVSSSSQILASTESWEGLKIINSFLRWNQENSVPSDPDCRIKFVLLANSDWLRDTVPRWYSLEAQCSQNLYSISVFTIKTKKYWFTLVIC